MPSSGVAPSGANTICVDFDGTIVRWADLQHTHDSPLTHAAETIGRFKDMGYRIYIFTSRLSPMWHMASGETFEAQYAYVKDTLRKLNIPYDWIGAEKVPAIAYIDDRAITVDEGDWDKVEQVFLNSISPYDLAWAAGIFEGEGWIYARPGFPNNVQVGVEMTDEDVIMRLNAIFPGNVRVRDRADRPNDKTIYQWRRQSKYATLEFLTAVLPFLGERRKAKALEVMEGAK